MEDYIEGALDQTTVKEISRHLQSCAGCTKELEYLKQYLSSMKDLEKVEAPDDFLERVHRRMEEESEKRRLFRTLFSPPRLKIPLELSAITAALLAVIFVLHVTRPMKHEGPAAVEKKTEITEALPSGEKKGELAKPKQETRPPEHPEKTVSEPALQVKKIKPSETGVSSEESSAVKEAVSSEKTPVAERKMESKAKGAEELREGGGPGGLHPVPELTVVMVLPGEMGKEEESLNASLPAAKAASEYDKALKAPPAETVEGEEETYRLEPAAKTGNSALEKAADLVVGLVRSEGGKLVSKNLPQTPDNPLTVTADIPGTRLNDFLEQLGRFGEIQVPPAREAEKKTSKVVRIRIEIRRHVH